jgi:hypothetical protein
MARAPVGAFRPPRFATRFSVAQCNSDDGKSLAITPSETSEVSATSILSNYEKRLCATRAGRKRSFVRANVAEGRNRNRSHVVRRGRWKSARKGNSLKAYSTSRPVREEGEILPSGGLIPLLHHNNGHVNEIRRRFIGSKCN